MASVCFYFHVHQPCRLRRYSVFDTKADYFDDAANREILQKVADKCYRPANRCLLDLIERNDGRFRIAFSITGVVLEQLEEWAPDVLESFRKLAASGCVEFVCETYYHSLASLYSPEEFAAQVELQRQKLKETFDAEPTVFRNTELIYNNDLSAAAADLGFRYVLCEGADHLLGWRSPNFVYTPPGHSDSRLLLKNYRLSDDIAFRFGDRSWSKWPLTAERFARWVNRVNGNGFTVNLFMDYETFGEHQWADTGIFDFLTHLPGEILAYPDNDFRTPSQVARSYEPIGEYDVPHLTSWADTERDLSAWLGNAMQADAVSATFRLEQAVKSKGDEALLRDWRRMTTSDHTYYMSTKYFADGDVHTYFSPYESPYDSYINYMNVLDNLRARVGA